MVSSVANTEKAYDGPIPLRQALTLKLKPGAYVATIETPRCWPVPNFFVVGTAWDRSVTINWLGNARALPQSGGYVQPEPDSLDSPHIGIVIHAPTSVTNVVSCLPNGACEQASHQGDIWYFDAAYATNDLYSYPLTVYEGKRVVHVYPPTLETGGFFERFLTLRP